MHVLHTTHTHALFDGCGGVGVGNANKISVVGAHSNTNSAATVTILPV